MFICLIFIYSRLCTLSPRRRRRRCWGWCLGERPCEVLYQALLGRDPTRDPEIRLAWRTHAHGCGS